MTRTHCIIGASSDIATSLINKLLEQGDNLHLITRSINSLEQFKKSPQCTITEVDVTDTNALKEAISSYKGPYASLVYFPGSIVLKSLSMVTDEDVLEHFKINTLGAMNAVKFSQKKLLEGEGSVVFISTVAVQKGFTNHTVISMCKGALEGLTKSLAKELSPTIRVNCVAPSLVKTKLSHALLTNPSLEEAIAKSHPLKRLGESEDIAQAVAFLISENSSWITGQILNVDGGRSTLD